MRYLGASKKIREGISFIRIKRIKKEKDALTKLVKKNTHRCIVTCKLV